MADLQKVIEIVFQGTDEVGGAVVSVTKGLDAVANKAQDVTEPLASATDFVLKMDAALLALGVTMVGVAVNQAGKFQDATSEINTLLEISPEKFDALKDSILDYSRSSTASLESINASVYSAISAGTEYSDVIGVVAQAEQLAVAGRGDLNDSTVLLVSSLNAYGESADEAGRYSDILFAAVKEGQTTLPELAAGLAQVTSTAAAAEVPFSDVAAAVADLTAKGLPTSQAITAIKAALSNIIKPSTAAAAAAKELGVEFDLQALQTKGLDGLLRALSEATGGNATEMGRFFASTEALNGVMALSADGAKTFTERLGEIRNSAGATGEAYAKMVDSFVNVNQNLQNNIQVTLIQVGDKLLAQYGETAKALGQVFDGVGEGIGAGALDPVLDVINAFGVTAQSSLEDIARNLPQALELIDWSGVIDALEGLGGAIAGLFDGVDVSTPEGLAKAMQKVVDAGEFLINVTKGIVAGLKPFIEGLTKLLDEMVDLSPETESAAGEILGFGKGLNVMLGFLGPAAEGLGSIGVGLQAIAGASVVKTLTAASGATTKFALSAKALAAPLGAAGVTIGQIVTNPAGAGGLYSLFSDLAPVVTELAVKLSSNAEAIEKTKEALDTAGSSVRDYGEAQLLTADDVAKAIELEKEFQSAIKQETANINAADDALLLRGQRFKEQKVYTEELVDGVITYTQKTTSKTAATKADTAATKDAVTESEKYRLALQKIASDERIANIEAKVSLETADLEAATARTIANFESIDNTITSTGDLLGTLFEQFAQADSLRDKWTIQDQIKIENELREEAAALQSALTREQIEYLRQKAASLARGDALIKITGDGLEPELEAFMWKIIDRVQVRASDEGAEFLLGLA